MSRFWFYLLVALSYYAMLVWSWYALTRLQRNPTRGFRWRLAGWLFVLALPSLWLTFRLNVLLPSTAVPANFAFMVLLIGVFGFSAATGLGYLGFTGARIFAALRRLRRGRKSAAAAAAPTAPTATVTATAGAAAVTAATAAGSALSGAFATAAEGLSAAATVPQPTPTSPLLMAQPPISLATATATTATVPAPTPPAARWIPPSDGTPEAIQMSRRRWLQAACYGYFGGLCLTAGGAAWTQAAGLQIQRRQIASPRLPKAFQGYRILQVADIHSGAYMPLAQMRRIRDAIEQQHADLIVFTGDQVDRRQHELPPFLEAFNGLSARDGVFGILGNHDYISGGRKVAEGMQANGIPMLINQAVRLRRGEQSLVLGGLDDLWHGNPDWQKTFADTTPDDFKICLAHNPNCWDFLSPNGIDLTLSGHTHGGQINLLVDSLSPARLLSPYVRGLFQRDHSQLFVSVGVGYVGIPVRIGVPAEIVEITLV